MITSMELPCTKTSKIVRNVAMDTILINDMQVVTEWVESEKKNI